MAIDVETIGVAVDSSGVVKGTKELDKFGKAADSASREADKVGSTSKKSFGELATAARAGLLGATALAAAVVGVGSSVLKSAIQMEKLSNTLKFSTGSAANASKELDYLRDVTNRLGLEFVTTASAYAKFSAAAKGTNLEGQKTRDIFEAVAKASTTLGLSADETGGALKAIEQIISKGTVSAEELRGQLGERLPGAFQIAARAMGVTTQELGKMLEQGQLVSDVFLPKFAEELTKTLGDSPNSAAGSAQAQLNRLTNAWTEFKKTIAESGVITIVVRLIEGTAGALKFVTTGLSDISSDKNWQKTKLAQLMEMRDQKNFRFFSEAQINSEINKLRRSLGIAQQFDAQTNPATGLSPNGMIAPNFGVSKADGTGGYDARLNNQKELDEQAKNYKKLIDDKKRKEKEFLDYRNRLEAELNKTAEDMGVAALKTRDKIAKEEYERQQKYMELLQKQANANFDEAQRESKRLSDQAQREADDLRRSLTDALLRSFERGEGGAKAFFNNLKNIFKARTFQIGIDFVLSKTGLSSIFGVLSSLLSGGALAGEASGAGFSISGLKDSFSAFSNGLDASNIAFEQSIQSFGTFITDFGGIGTKIGGAISQYSGFLSSAAPFLQAGLSLLSGDLKGAAFQGAGAAIGSVFGGPIGGAVGSFLGGALGGLFGGKDIPLTGDQVRGSSVNGNFSSSSNVFGKASVGAASSLTNLTKQFSLVYSSILDAFGATNNFSTNAIFRNRTNEKAYFGLGGGISEQDKLFSSKNAGFEAFAQGVLGEGLVKAIQKSNLGANIKKFFDGLTKPEDVLDAINTLVTLKASLADLPPIFDAVRNAIDTTAYTTSIDALKAQFQATQTFVDLFYSDAEKFNIFQGQLQSQFADLNKTIPTSRDQYRALVESINVVDEATRDQFNGLIALAPAMKQYFDYLEQQADGINQVNEAIAQGLDRNLFSTYADFVTAQANASAGLTYTGSIGDLSVRRAQGDAELANAVKSLVAQQARTDQILAQIAESTRRTREINERWNGDGLPETRVI